DVEEVGASGSDGAGLALPLALPAAFPVALPGADFVWLAAVLAAAFSFGGALSLVLSLSFAAGLSPACLSLPPGLALSLDAGLSFALSLALLGIEVVDFSGSARTLNGSCKTSAKMPVQRNAE